MNNQLKQNEMEFDLEYAHYIISSLSAKYFELTKSHKVSDLDCFVHKMARTISNTIFDLKPIKGKHSTSCVGSSKEDKKWLKKYPEDKTVAHHNISRKQAGEELLHMDWNADPDNSYTDFVTLYNTKYGVCHYITKEEHSYIHNVDKNIEYVLSLTPDQLADSSYAAFLEKYLLYTSPDFDIYKECGITFREDQVDIIPADVAAAA